MAAIAVCQLVGFWKFGNAALTTDLKRIPVRQLWGRKPKVGFWLLGLTILFVAFFLGGMVGCALLDRS
ncbi:MAG: hypothetical protein E5Y65_15430 [Mesorhizobium sp.]|jgi:hypothetical protein|uniref:hypothetical protein n=1 Tax=Mesorhizobium sp. TaxID=1871066 RepID=UPI0012020203|nr:hypothetical protein [Mesorhizobium sp.]TIL73212.1 MAG: hypothetical protein E5Y70_17800 [Mesorhizobium sp.]TIL90058.1 MAG: hypothetical protein E5Y65_15430 [Mesorhizobium sp.]TIM01793.1 MAG: hypothetical protein E5Y64_09445 [Mesorhizobium sp.]